VPATLSRNCIALVARSLISTPKKVITMGFDESVAIAEAVGNRMIAARHRYFILLKNIIVMIIGLI
jgi:hypothetical protein